MWKRVLLVLCMLLSTTGLEAQQNGYAMPGLQLEFWTGSNPKVSVDGNGVFYAPFATHATVVHAGHKYLIGVGPTKAGTYFRPHPTFWQDFEWGIARWAQVGYNFQITQGAVQIIQQNPFEGWYSYAFDFSGAVNETNYSYIRFSPMPQYDSVQAKSVGGWLNEVWLEYYVRFPTNYCHQNQYNDFLKTNHARFKIRTLKYGTCGAQLAQHIYGDQWTMMNMTPVPLVAPTGPIIPGQWAKVQLYLKMNHDSITDNGIVELYIDDALISRATGRIYDNNPAEYGVANHMKSIGFFGITQGGFPSPTTIQIDNVTVWENPPPWWDASSWNPLYPLRINQILYRR